ncbi:hypothetical protein VTI28DRAFT_7213 [Corynascus sepedonium]
METVANEPMAPEPAYEDTVANSTAPTIGSAIGLTAFSRLHAAKGIIQQADALADLSLEDLSGDITQIPVIQWKHQTMASGWLD